MAGTLRHSAPREGMFGTAAGSVAGQLEAGGRYLQDHGLSDIGEDLTGLIRNYPAASICVAFGLGWLIGMASRR
jgi:hypothetical protein